MNSLRRLRCLNSKVWRNFSQSSSLQQSATAEPFSIPQPEGDVAVSPKIEKIISEITQLTLLEVSELSGALKKRLNLPDAPMMPMGALNLAAVAPKEEVEEAEVQQKQTVFKVKLVKFDEKQKVALIKEVKALMEGMNLVQAKKFVESAPAILKSEVPEDEAKQLLEALTKVGAEVVIE